MEGRGWSFRLTASVRAIDLMISQGREGKSLSTRLTLFKYWATSSQVSFGTLQLHSADSLHQLDQSVSELTVSRAGLPSSPFATFSLGGAVLGGILDE